MRKILLLCATILLVGGCSASHFAGEEADQHGCTLKKDFWGNVYIKMTGDGECYIGKIKIKKDGKKYSVNVENVKVSQRVTEVTQASVEKLEAIAKVQEVQVAYMKEVMTGMTGIAKSMSVLFGDWLSVLSNGITQAMVEKYKNQTTQPTTQTAE